jgi:hypothetical protein
MTEEVVAGIDRASVEHAVCVVNARGIPTSEWTVCHDEAGIDGLCAELIELGVGRVALKRPDGILVDRLLAASIEVIAVHPAAIFRRACDKRLRGAIATLADSTHHWHPWARDVYRKARNRGQDHPHAIRTLGRAWTRVLWRCWHEQTPYDLTRHGNLNRLQTQGG